MAGLKIIFKRGALTHQASTKERKELTELLTNDEGNVRSFADFKSAAAEVVEKFQVTHLKTEYDTAVNSSYLAARWHEFDDEMFISRYKAAL